MVGPAAGPGVALAEELDLDRRGQVAVEAPRHAEAGAHLHAAGVAHLAVADQRRQQPPAGSRKP